ncbi:L,D-transpeptidase [Oceaniglobus trochenteri]|uniref:L,D-transpeptidase n=1 Tax=Oceaniglobus trochenteri TaxID=2763260 RepID=UPI001CFFB179|nr:L,D-transpeptidase [Oceaniglobus trochenteri]
MNRRDILKTGVAFGLLGATPLSAAPTIPTYNVPEQYLPREVSLRVNLAPGEIHVLPDEFALYWTLPENRAIRYTCGIGRVGLYEPGEFYVGAKKEFPSWKPTPEMVKRSPEQYARYAEDGLPGGLSNPLGARALYLFQPQRGDTFLRIHGTDKPNTIGRAVSNGCARLVNDQIADLYNRVPMQSRVVLYARMLPNRS